MGQWNVAFCERQNANSVLTQLGGDVEAEVWVEVDLLVSQLDQGGIATLHKGLGQHRLQTRLQLLTHILRVMPQVRCSLS